MLLSGFTFIRNALKYDFPVRECIESMLPLVDELVVNVGKSEDATLDLIRSIQSPKIKIVESVWDDALTKDGLVLSQQTNIALDHCSGRWCLYLQADEAIHEKDFSAIRHAVEDEDASSHPVDGFKFKYLHFYGGYNLVQQTRKWYPEEIRIIRKNSGARSFGDAQTFRLAGDAFLKTKTLDAHLFHYGHARAPEVMEKKIQYFHRFWHGDAHDIKTDQAYQNEMKDLVWYWGTHPQVYTKRVSGGKEWSLTPAHAFEKSGGKKPFRFIVVYGDNDFSFSLRCELEKRFPEAIVYTVSSIWRWSMTAIKLISARRDQKVLIDLRAEKTWGIVFYCWILDALWLFKTRIAHVPNGYLPKSRKRFYSAIHYGKAEEPAKGFVVPREKFVSQILKWFGDEK